MAISKSNPHERVKAIIRSVMPALKRNSKVLKKMEKPLEEMEKPPKLAVSSLTRSEVYDMLGLSKDPRSAEIWKLDEADVIPVPPEVCKYYLSHYFI
jgi:hypothetical protein